MNQDYIKKLIRILEESKIDSIQLSSFWGMSKIKLFRSPQGGPKTLTSMHSTENLNLNTEVDTPPSIKVQKEEEISISSQLEKNRDIIEDSLEENSSLHPIKAPLVGTFYLSPKPGEPAFIKAGDKIEAGQTICIIEAMKIFNEIESDVSGIVREILIEDSSPVEYGQTIISVELND